MLIKKQSSTEGSEVTYPLLGKNEETIAVQSCTTYNSLMSSSSATSSGGQGSPVSIFTTFFDDQPAAASGIPSPASPPAILASSANMPPQTMPLSGNNLLAIENIPSCK